MNTTRIKETIVNIIYKTILFSYIVFRGAALKITAEALCLSTAEYTCPVWDRSGHAREVNAPLNKTV